jgi:phage shock protein C
MRSIADEVDRLAAQRDAGRLSDTEFEAAKSRLFAETEALPPPAGGTWRAAAADADARLGALRRSSTDRWIGGVCGGIARMAGIESWIIRLIFVASLLLAGGGFLPYVLLWIFVPLEGR